MFGAIILAAGSSRRFGEADKRKARLPNGKLLLQQSMENARRAFDRALLVLGADDGELEDDLERLFFDPGMRIFRAPDSAGGMGHSLANAIGEVNDWHAAFVFLADMPHIQPQTLHVILSKAKDLDPESPWILTPTFNGQPGHPVGFHHAYFDELSRLTGDQGAKPVVQAHRESVIQVPVEDAGVIVDIDRPEDLVE